MRICTSLLVILFFFLSLNPSVISARPWKQLHVGLRRVKRGALDDNKPVQIVKTEKVSSLNREKRNEEKLIDIDKNGIEDELEEWLGDEKERGANARLVEEVDKEDIESMLDKIEDAEEDEVVEAKEEDVEATQKKTKEENEEEETGKEQVNDDDKTDNHDDQDDDDNDNDSDENDDGDSDDDDSSNEEGDDSDHDDGDTNDDSGDDDDDDVENNEEDTKAEDEDIDAALEQELDDELEAEAKEDELESELEAELDAEQEAEEEKEDEEFKEMLSNMMDFDAGNDEYEGDDAYLLIDPLEGDAKISDEENEENSESFWQAMMNMFNFDPDWQDKLNDQINDMNDSGIEDEEGYLIGDDYEFGDVDTDGRGYLSDSLQGDDKEDNSAKITVKVVGVEDIPKQRLKRNV